MPGAGNLISGNGNPAALQSGYGYGSGVDIYSNGTSVTGTLVEGNLIGTDITGTQPLGNLLDGVHIQDSASNSTIGGTVAGAGNLIANNGANGVTVGSSPSDNSVGDAILENLIYANAKLGIDLGNDGVTLNDSIGHTGPNLFQDFPVLTSALTIDGQTTITGTISGSPDTTYCVEVFSDATADPSGYGQGQTYLTFVDVTTNATGTASFTVTTSSAVAAGRFITATATDPAGDTSEFSADIINSPLGVIAIADISPSPRNTPVSSIDVTFSEPINTSSLVAGALTLTDDGGANLITSGVSIGLVSGNTYAIGGLTTLTNAQGEYTLIVNAADIQDENGISGTNSLSMSWLMDSTAPSSHVANSLGTSQTSDSFPVSVTFTDPGGAGGSPASGVSAVELWVSVNNGAFSLYQTMNITPAASGTETFTFIGQDRNTYAFHSIAIDAADNTESKNGNTIEASTSVPDLHPPVTHVLTSSSFNSNNGVFTLNWSGTDPDQNSGTPAGSIALVDVYVEVDGGTPTLIGQESGVTSVGGVYSGSLTYTHWPTMQRILTVSSASASMTNKRRRPSRPRPT